MTLFASIAVCALAALLFLVTALGRLRRRRLMGAAAHGGTAAVLLLVCASLGLVGSNLLTYQRLSHEQLAGELRLSSAGERAFNAVLRYPNGEHADFALRGDEWQVDARILKWHAFANLLGFDTAYRLERISGRYTRIEDERALPRTVYDLAPPGQFDVWSLVRRYHQWVPWVDALYGNATYLPMADGAAYEITVSQSGLVSRPQNQAARDAVGNWH
jgi:hypothetical protein